MREVPNRQPMRKRGSEMHPSYGYLSVEDISYLATLNPIHAKWERDRLIANAKARARRAKKLKEENYV